MFKTGKIRLGITLLIVSILCFGIGTFLLFITNGWPPTLGKYTVDLNEEKVSAIKDVNDIFVDVSSADINIIPEDRADVKAVLSGYINSSSKVTQPELTLEKSGSKLNISVKMQKVYIGFTSMDINLDIYIPKNYSQDLGFDLSSGDVIMNNSLTLNNLDFSLSSGDVTIADLTCNKLFYHSSSGSLEAVKLNTKETEFELSSGHINISDFTGSLTGESSSGDINIAYKEFNDNVDVHVSSGEIKLKLPENSEFYLDAHASSGDVECNFPITLSEKQKDNSLKGVVKDDKNKVLLSASSGEISVLR